MARMNGKVAMVTGAGNRAGGDEADRTGGSVGTRLERLAQRQQLMLLPDLEAKRIGRVPLVPAAAQVLPVEVLEREQHGGSFSGMDSPGGVAVVLIVVALVAIVEVVGWVERSDTHQFDTPSLSPKSLPSTSPPLAQSTG